MKSPNTIVRALVVFLYIALPTLALAQDRPVPQIKKVLIISVDGLRPDLMLRANTPHFHELFHSGCYTFWARTTDIAITLPSHISMLSGVKPDRHGILFNDDRATTQPSLYPNVPTLFDLAKKKGYSTAVATGKLKFVILNARGAVDENFEKAADSPEVAQHAVAMLRDKRPDVMFVHFPDADNAGHSKGWGSPEQTTAIERIDAALGTLMSALESSGLKDSTLVILSADHGGSGKQHGAGDERSRFIPWIAVGPGVRKDYDLTLIREININTEDTFATACWVMGIPLPEGIDGKPIRQIFPGVDLMHEAMTQPSAVQSP